MDAHSWATRDARFAKKFALGRKHIPELFAGMNLPREPEAIALLGFASTRSRDMIGGGRILLVQDLLGEIICGLEGVRVASGAVPEDKPLLRTLQFVKEHKSSLFA